MNQASEDPQNVELRAKAPDLKVSEPETADNALVQVENEPTAKVASGVLQRSLAWVRHWPALVTLWIIPILGSYLVVAIPGALWQAFEHPYREVQYAPLTMVQYHLGLFLHFFSFAPHLILFSTLPFLVLVSLVPVKQWRSGNAYLTHNFLVFVCVLLYHSISGWNCCGHALPLLHLIFHISNFWATVVPIVPAMLVRAWLMPITEQGDDQASNLIEKIRGVVLYGVAFVIFVALGVGMSWPAHPAIDMLPVDCSDFLRLAMPLFTYVLILGLYKFVDGGLTIRKEIKARKAKEIEKRQEVD